MTSPNLTTPSVWRYRMVLGIMGCVFLSLIGRLAWIQLVAPEKLIHQGDLRSMRIMVRQAIRGIIADRHGEPLAVSVPVEAVWADPFVLSKLSPAKRDHAWKMLAKVLDTDVASLLTKVGDTTKRFVYLQRQVTPSVATYIRSLKLDGIYLRPEARRFYPTGEISAHVVGLTNIDGQGVEGVERTYDDWLTALAGQVRVRKDRHGRIIERIGLVEKGKNANDLYLSLDQRLQALAYRKLKQATELHNATSGSLVLLDVTTGEILAMVNTPSYNPNDRNQYEDYRVRNRAVTDTYEPGSTVKPLVILSALEANVTSWDEVFNTSPFFIGAKRISDVSKRNQSDLGNLLRYSSNVGMSKIALRMDPQAIINTFGILGFGIDSGAGLLGESSGYLPQRTRWSDLERATLSFGYGLRVSALQLASAYATLGNKGKRLPISLRRLDTPPKGEQVVSPSDSQAILTVLGSMLEPQGTLAKGGVSGYHVAGKSGTAKVAINGGYGSDYLSWFVGVAPLSNPKFAMAIVINEPQSGNYYGGAVAAPLFSDVMAGALQFYNILPDKPRP